MSGSFVATGRCRQPEAGKLSFAAFARFEIANFKRKSELGSASFAAKLASAKVRKVVESF